MSQSHLSLGFYCFPNTFTPSLGSLPSNDDKSCENILQRSDQLVNQQMFYARRENSRMQQMAYWSLTGWWGIGKNVCVVLSKVTNLLCHNVSKPYLTFFTAFLWWAFYTWQRFQVKISKSFHCTKIHPFKSIWRQFSITHPQIYLKSRISVFKNIFN